jgi:hypothetical protein
MDTMQQAAPTAPETEGPEVDPARKNLVSEWLGKIKAAKDDPRTADAFKQMRKNMDFAARGAEEEWVKNGNYTVPILVRHINQSVAQLYARNPKAVAKRKRRLMHKLWDGKPETLQAAMQAAMLGDPNAGMIVQEIAAVQQYTTMMDRLAETLVLLWDYFVSEQGANFKQSLKAMVRRTKVTGVGYLKIGFQRILEPRPDVTAEIEDTTRKIAAMKAILEDVSEGKIDDESPRMAELQTLLRDLQQQEYLIVREGPVFDFPRSTALIIDPACRHLKTFAGAGWIAEEFEMTRDEVKENYGVELDRSAVGYNSEGKPYQESAPHSAKDKTVYRVYEVQNKRLRQTFTLCEGHADFLKEPAEPYCSIERFFTIFPLVFNEVEHEKMLYPPSDIELAKDIQNEYNRSRHGLREHRIAARPYWVEDGSLEDTDKDKLSAHAAHAVITVSALATGQKITDKLAAGPTAPIDPNLYETEMHYNDLLRVVGVQEANLGGGTSGSTATESSIAEQSRGASIADNVDDLDEMLSEVAKAFSHIALAHLSKQTVIEIVGEGAVWPDMPQTRQEIAKDLFLEIKAGSSGRPNRAAELANMERAVPMLIQIPGINPRPLAEQYNRLLDIGIDVEELVVDGLPSITAMNAAMSKPAAAQPGTGDPATDPGQQGPQGAQNAPNPQTVAPGGQPGYPAPMPGA